MEILASPAQVLVVQLYARILDNRILGDFTAIDRVIPRLVNYGGKLEIVFAKDTILVGGS